MARARRVRVPSSLKVLDPWGDASVWLVLQQAIAATIAWLIAAGVVGNPEPFFAPIAAVVALNIPLGQRGSNALRLLLGVGIGIAIGEIGVLALGTEWWTLGLATFAAMIIARALDQSRLVIAQAAAGAILTVATSAGQEGPQRLVDALIGAGVALVFSQLLFSPEPVALVRRAARTALIAMANGLDVVADAFERNDDELASQALEKLRNLRGELADLAQAARAGDRVVRHSVLWRRRGALVVAESEFAENVDLLGGSCLLLARTASSASPADRAGLAQDVRRLRDLLTALSEASTDQVASRQLVERAAALADPQGAATEASPLVPPATAVRLVAADLLLVAGRRASSP